jgi:hypothetical protein
VSAEPLRLGLVGCGRLAERGYVRAVARAKGVEIVAVADPDRSRRGLIAAKLGASGHGRRHMRTGRGPPARTPSAAARLPSRPTARGRSSEIAPRLTDREGPAHARSTIEGDAIRFRATLQLGGKTATGIEVPPEVVSARSQQASEDPRDADSVASASSARREPEDQL